MRDDDEELGYVAIGFEGPNFSQYLDRYALEVAKEIVGSWNMSYGNYILMNKIGARRN